jgi:mannose/cellobiose epimerase-like protein (N-acyl-D-glucosamine 2-epimerase family)
MGDAAGANASSPERGSASGPLGTVPTRVGRVQAGLRDWLFSLALPFWCRNGVDRAATGQTRGAHEFLELSGHPGRPDYRRMRVQARQLFAFSTLARRGHADAAALVPGIYRFMVGGAFVESDGTCRWASRLAPDGRVLDGASDLYDIASVLFGLAAYARFSGDPAPTEQARNTLDFLRRRMAHPSGGFADSLPPRHDWRHQAPHMHLLEAALAWWEVDDDGRWAGLAREMLRLLRKNFLDPADDTLGERFHPDWHRAPGADGEPVIPGHHAQWMWLLQRHRVLLGDDTRPELRRLEAFCLAHGVGHETGLVRDEVGRGGDLRRGSSRLWPQCELLKAQSILHRQARADGDEEDAARREWFIERAADNLLSRFLLGRDVGTMPPGTWIDQLDSVGRPAADRIPASAFYHLVSAWTELEQVRPLPPDAG